MLSIDAPLRRIVHSGLGYEIALGWWYDHRPNTFLIVSPYWPSFFLTRYANCKGQCSLLQTASPSLQKIPPIYSRVDISASAADSRQYIVRLPNAPRGLYSSDAHYPDSHPENNQKNSRLPPIQGHHQVLNRIRPDAKAQCKTVNPITPRRSGQAGKP